LDGYCQDLGQIRNDIIRRIAHLASGEIRECNKRTAHYGQGIARALEKLWRIFNFPGDRAAGAVDVPDLIVEPVLQEFEAVGVKGVCCDDIDAALDVFAMGLLDEGRVRQAELVEAGVQINALALEHGPHAAITQEDTFGQGVEKTDLHFAIMVFWRTRVQGRSHREGRRQAECGAN
jgi:hypothetical protein